MTTINLKATGENLKKLRIEHGYTIKSLGEHLGINTVRAVYKWEVGLNLPTLDHLVVLEELYGLKSIDELIITSKNNEPIDK